MINIKEIENASKSYVMIWHDPHGTNYVIQVVDDNGNYLQEVEYTEYISHFNYNNNTGKQGAIKYANRVASDHGNLPVYMTVHWDDAVTKFTQVGNNDNDHLAKIKEIDEIQTVLKIAKSLDKQWNKDFKIQPTASNIIKILKAGK